LSAYNTQERRMTAVGENLHCEIAKKEEKTKNKLA
jgi:hypothetical protein